MCHFCGCPDMPLLRGYIAEHERVINLGGAAVRALDRGDQDHARSLLASMADELGSRWRGEEDGLFPASLTALGAEEWGAAMAAWQRAHPERDLMADA
jgi:hypothetical protein